MLQCYYLHFMTAGEEDRSLERTSCCFLFPFSKTLAGTTSITAFTWQFLIFLSFYNMQHKGELMDPPERDTASSFFSPSFSKTEAGIQSTAVLLLSVFPISSLSTCSWRFLIFLLQVSMAAGSQSVALLPTSVLKFFLHIHVFQFDQPAETVLCS